MVERVGCGASGSLEPDARGGAVELEGKTVVVTGGASGIGRAMAERFAAAGSRLVLADVERPRLDEAVEALRGQGREVIGVPTDVSDRSQVHGLADAAIETFGAVDVVCNNAGVGSRGLPIAELPIEDFQWLLGVNLYGVIHGIEAFLPHLRAQNEGHIVNTCSISSFLYMQGMGPYNAAKAAVLALSETLQYELQDEGSGVGVSVLCPGWVRTNLGTADRNRPEALAVSFTTEQAAKVQARRERIAEVFARDGIEPERAAELVEDAVRTGRFYVLTHPGMTSEIERRFERIVSGGEPQAPVL